MFLRSATFSVFLAIGSLFVAQVAHGQTTTCELVDDDYISVDGMVDDWTKITQAGAVAGNAKSGAFSVGCAYRKGRLFLAVHARDRRIVRTHAASKATEDSVTISLAAGTRRYISIRVFPGVDKFEPRYTVNGKPSPSWLDVADSLQPDGYSFEVELPLAKVPGYGAGTPALAASITMSNATRGKPTRPVRFRGRFQFEESKQVERAFLAKAGLVEQQLRIDKLADVDGVRGAERVVFGGRVLGVMGKQFAFMDLPVVENSDVLAVKVVDLAGRGRSHVVSHLRQHGNGGSREVVTVWEVGRNGTFRSVLGFEVRKELSGNVMTSRWRLVKKGRHRAMARGESRRGFDILVEATEPVGWDEDNYEEEPATDVDPILRPWEDDVATVYYFTGDGVQKTAPTR